MIVGVSFFLFSFFFSFFDIKIESLLVYGIFDCLVYPHQWSMFFSAWSISHLIADIQDLAMSFVSCNFSWISRCRNSTAHSTTKFSLASNDSFIFTLAYLPPCLVDVCKENAPLCFAVF